MTIANWLSPDVMRPLGWALFHFLWQGTALAALAAVTMALIRRASVRYLLAVGTLILMLAAPVATFFSYWQTDSGSARLAAPASTAASWEVPQPDPAAHVSVASRGIAPDIFPWMVEAWLAGVVFFGLRTAGGFLLLERMRRRQSIAVSVRLQATCLALQRRIGLERAIRYCHCQWLDAPAVMGWFRPIVLLPITALTGLSEAQLQVVIAHELAHVKRLDSFVNAFQVAVETLLFYHPAVWWLNQRIRTERENCCDDIAIALCGNPVEYARALTLMEEWRSAPALAMAANRGPLSARIARLVGIKSLSLGLRGSSVTTSVLCLAAALLAGNAFFGIAHTATAQSTAPSAPSRPVAPSPPSRPIGNTPGTNPTPAQAPVAAREPVPVVPYIEAMKSAGMGDMTVDQLIALKIQGVTPEYVRGMQDVGLHPDADQLVAMRVQGVTPEYVRDLRAAGITVSGDELIAMKVQGIDADYVRGLQAVGLHPDADELIAMKVQGVTPEYVRGLQEQEVKADADEIVGMKVQGVTPEYVREIRALGLKPDADGLISMRVQGVTPEYIKILQSAGFKFDVEELIEAKVQGITPEFIEKARKHGFQNLTLEKLIELKNMGVLEAPSEI
jgi:beta-lactamase regulating signal transducer with metallopeptidase domain